MGGMVGMWLGANAPQRVDKLILSNTSAYFADKEIWNDRIKTVRDKGLGGDRVGHAWSAGSPRTSASASRKKVALGRRHVPRDRARRLHRLRRGGARHGPPRDHPVDHGADPGHRRPARSRHHASRRASSSRSRIPRASLTRARRRASRQCRAAARLHRCGARLPARRNSARRSAGADDHRLGTGSEAAARGGTTVTAAIDRKRARDHAQHQLADHREQQLAAVESPRGVRTRVVASAATNSATSSIASSADPRVNF